MTRHNPDLDAFMEAEAPPVIPVAGPLRPDNPWLDAAFGLEPLESRRNAEDAPGTHAGPKVESGPVAAVRTRQGGRERARRADAEDSPLPLWTPPVWQPPTEAEFLEIGQPPIGSRPVPPVRAPWRAVYPDPMGRPHHCCLSCGRAGKLSERLHHAAGCPRRGMF